MSFRPVALREEMGLESKFPEDMPVALATPAPSFLDPSQRPPKLQRVIDHAFNRLVVQHQENWGLYGGCNRYSMCGVDEYKALAHIMRTSPDRDTFYALGIGEGDMSWVRHMTRTLSEDESLPLGSTVHVIGVRGESYDGASEVITQGKRVTVVSHFLGACKIEEIGREFEQRGFNLVGRVDVIVSHWCLPHVSDPVGTVQQVYKLMKPRSGLFMHNGFKYKQNGALQSDLALTDLFMKMGCRVLCYSNNQALYSMHYVMQRIDERPCQIPLRYAGCEIVSEYECNFSRCITAFEETLELEPLPYVHVLNMQNRLCGHKALFEQIKQNGILTPAHLGWNPLLKPEEGLKKPLMHALARESNIGAMQVLADIYNLNESDEDGATLLHIAVANDHIEMVEFLLERGVKLNLQDCKGNTPLHCAVLKGNYRLAKLLLEKGADKNCENATTLDTPLRIALKMQHDPLIQLLSPPLHNAILQGDRADLDVELQKPDCDVNAFDSAGRTPLLLAVKKGDFELVELLLRRGADPDRAHDSFGIMGELSLPILAAIDDRREDIIALLLREGASSQQIYAGLSAKRHVEIQSRKKPEDKAFFHRILELFTNH